jgi:hypothetical protein
MVKALHPHQKLNVRHLGMVKTPGLTNMESRSPSVASLAYQISRKPSVGSKVIRRDTQRDRRTDRQAGDLGKSKNVPKHSLSSSHLCNFWHFNESGWVLDVCSPTAKQILQITLNRVCSFLHAVLYQTSQTYYLGRQHLSRYQEWIKIKCSQVQTLIKKSIQIKSLLNAYIRISHRKGCSGRSTYT